MAPVRRGSPAAVAGMAAICLAAAAAHPVVITIGAGGLAPLGSRSGGGGPGGSGGDGDRPNWRANYRRALPFTVARRAARSLGFSRADWDDWVMDGKAAPSLGPYMPSDPEAIYPDEWQGWDDWLGVPRDYEDARAVVRGFAMQSQEEWWDFVARDADVLSELRVPARPHIYYPVRGRPWPGYDDWLGLTPQTLWVPREWSSGAGPTSAGQTEEETGGGGGVTDGSGGSTGGESGRREHDDGEDSG